MPRSRSRRLLFRTSRPAPRAGRRPRLLVEEMEPRTLPSAGFLARPAVDFAPAVNHVATPSGYTPPQITHGYGFDNINFNGTPGDGRGQTIAIVDVYHNAPLANDLNTFDQTFFQPGSAGARPASSFLTQVDEHGGQSFPTASPNGSWELESSLDVQWAHAVAPAANILLVEAASTSLGDLLTAVDTARQAPGVVAVSMSWGGTEFSSERAYDNVFTTPAGHPGVTFVASSGDAGAYYHGPSFGLWPALSPNVLAVGGTTLSLSANGTYQGESAWRWGGGGTSVYEPKPAYQNGFVRGPARGGPDVAYDANNLTGFPVYSSTTYLNQNGWFQVGGTSAGAPQWAALVAIADQGRGPGNSLDGAGQTLKAVYQMAASPSTYFHDISSGSNGFYTATTGFDLTTGAGTPKADRVAQFLANVSATTTASPASQAAATRTSTSQAGRPSQGNVKPNAVIDPSTLSQSDLMRLAALAAPAPFAPDVARGLSDQAPPSRPQVTPPAPFAAGQTFGGPGASLFGGSGTVRGIDLLSGGGGGAPVLADDDGADANARPAPLPAPVPVPETPVIPAATAPTEGAAKLDERDAWFAEEFGGAVRIRTDRQDVSDGTDWAADSAWGAAVLGVALGTYRAQRTDDEEARRRRHR